jgi:hypothetical protein
MKAKGIAHGNYKHGLFGGITEYRYGTPKPKKHERIYRGEARQHVVQRAMDVLRDWRLSPFENEGTCRSGIRSALCLNGHGWHRADQEAAAIVAEGLRLLGATRPSWDQGQKEYVVPRENCSWCGVDIPDEFLHGRFNVRFCSDVCAKAAIAHRDYENDRKDSLAYRSAWDVINRSKNPSRPCKCCGRPFRPQHEKGQNTGEFCSRICAGDFRQTVPPRDCRQCKKRFKPRHAGVEFCSRPCVVDFRRVDRPLKDCLHCGTAFRPPNSTNPSKFCCRECQNAYGKPRQIERECEWCARTFVAAMPFARSCSKNCATYLSNARAGKFPKRLNPPVFDYVFAMAA